jgi:hypothetical protein
MICSLASPLARVIPNVYGRYLGSSILAAFYSRNVGRAC